MAQQKGDIRWALLAPDGVYQLIKNESGEVKFPVDHLG